MTEEEERWNERWNKAVGPLSTHIAIYLILVVLLIWRALK